VKIGEPIIGFDPQWKCRFVSGSKRVCQVLSKSDKIGDCERADTQKQR